MNRRLLLSFATLVFSAGLCQAASAGTFTLSLSNANQIAAPGNLLSYSGTVTNTSGALVDLDGIEFTTTGFSFVDTNPTCTGNMPCIDENPFIFNAPFTLSASGPTSSYTGVLFTVNVPLASALSSSSGFVEISGDTGDPNYTSITTNPVGFSTTVTPEPSSWLLMATGLVGLAIAYRFRSQTTPLMTRL